MTLAFLVLFHTSTLTCDVQEYERIADSVAQMIDAQEVQQ